LNSNKITTHSLENQLDNKNRSFYFKGFDGLRFIAAYLVVVSHAEQFSGELGLPSISKAAAVNLGVQGVRVFFVLSGFLITFLGLLEVEKNNKIVVRKFYTRRILRIWPLYYIILLLGVFFLPIADISFPRNLLTLPKDSIPLLGYIFMIPNIVFYVFGSFFSLSVLWSIGTEEQFYFVFPLIINKIKNILIKGLWILLFSILAIKGVSYYFSNHSELVSKSIYEFFRVLYLTLHFDSMVIGALGALIFKKINIEKHSKTLAITGSFSLVMIFILTKSAIKFNFLENTIFSFLYLGVLLTIADNNSIFSRILNNRLFVFGGKISYGIYMYHTLILGFILFYSQFIMDDVSATNIKYLIYIFTFGGTILVSHLSYVFIEKRFLKIKKTYTVVNN
jgi:peptidoglycan/LPS O-acetylase OafA/YrhL